MFKTHNMQILAGVGLGLIISILSIAMYHAAPTGSSLETFFFAIGGKMPDGIIQAATFACFFICIFGVQALNKRLEWEEGAYKARPLPETEQYVLYPEDVNRVKLEIIELEKHMGPRLLIDLIKQATTKFRADNSTAETLSMVETVSDMQRKQLERELWLIGICQTLIPALGFLGTVWGMAAAVLQMGNIQPTSAATPTGQATAVASPSINLQSLIDSMGTAFFTTILSIVLGIVVSIIVKRLETRVEDFNVNMKRYVVENLVNRIHK